MEKNFNLKGPFKEFTDIYAVLIAGIPSISEGLYPKEFLDKPINLISRTNPKKGLSLIPREVLNFVNDNGLNIYGITNGLSIMLANICMETLKSMNIKRGFPEIELLRHLRNAGSHGNIFTFNNIEPKFPAQWSSLKLDHNRKGELNPLQGTQCFGKYIDCADLVMLLKDIEDKYSKLLT